MPLRAVTVWRVDCKGPNVPDCAEQGPGATNPLGAIRAATLAGWAMVAGPDFVCPGCQSDSGWSS